jgi:NHL repeat-containing protein
MVMANRTPRRVGNLLVLSSSSLGLTPRAGAHLLRALVLGASFALLSSAALAGRAIGAAGPTCVGDCDNGGSVTVDEIVTGVNIALGLLSLDQCPRFDCEGIGRVEIDCIIKAVAAVLNGCDSTTPTSTTTPASTPLATSSATATVSEAATHTPTATPTATATASRTATASTTPPSCGTFITKWGGLGSGTGQFNFPADVAVDGDGNVFVVDSGNNRIEEFTNDGTFLAAFGGPGTGDGEFDTPTDVAVAGDGTVVVADTNNNRIQLFTSSGVFLGFFLAKFGSMGSGDGQFSGPSGVAVDGNGSIFVADAGNNRIQKFTNDGTFLAKWGSVGSGDGQFAGPVSVAVDGGGNVFVADKFNHRIQKFMNTGTFLAKWGSLGLGDGEFSDLESVAVDGDGNIFAADVDRIQKFTNDGIFVIQWGSLGNGDGQFNSAVGVAADGDGNVFVADEGHHVQKFACPRLSAPLHGLRRLALISTVP